MTGWAARLVPNRRAKIARRFAFRWLLVGCFPTLNRLLRKPAHRRDGRAFDEGSGEANREALRRLLLGGTTRLHPDEAGIYTAHADVLIFGLVVGGTRLAAANGDPPRSQGGRRTFCNGGLRGRAERGGAGVWFGWSLRWRGSAHTRTVNRAPGRVSPEGRAWATNGK